MADAKSNIAAETERKVQTESSLIRVIIAGESQIELREIRRVLESTSEFEIVGVAMDGESTIAHAAKKNPDIIISDVNLPQKDNFDMTSRIMETNPVPILTLATSWDSDEVKKAFKTLDKGAMAVFEKAVGYRSLAAEDLKDNFLETVHKMSELRPYGFLKPYEKSGNPKGTQLTGKNKCINGDVDLIVIGASIGGPSTLKQIISKLPEDFPVPIMVAQHIPNGFLNGMALWLVDSSDIPVLVAKDKGSIEAGHVYLASNQYLMGVTKKGTIDLSPVSGKQGETSISYLFRSAANEFGKKTVGILLTGMGKDGAHELKLIKDCGGFTFAQDRESALVYDMPGEAIAVGAAQFVLPPDEIAEQILKIAHSHKPYKVTEISSIIYKPYKKELETKRVNVSCLWRWKNKDREGVSCRKKQVMVLLLFIVILGIIASMLIEKMAKESMGNNFYAGKEYSKGFDLISQLDKKQIAKKNSSSGFKKGETTRLAENIKRKGVHSLEGLVKKSGLSIASTLLKPWRMLKSSLSTEAGNETEKAGGGGQSPIIDGEGEKQTSGDRDKKSAEGREEGAEISNKIVDNNGNFDESPKTEAGNETENGGGGGQSPIIDGEGEKQTSGDRDKESAEGREEGAEISNKIVDNNGNFDESPKTEAGNETENGGGGGQSPIIDGEGEKQTSGDRDKESAEGREEGAEISNKIVDNNGNFDGSPKTEAGNETEKAGGGGQSPIIDGEGEKQTSGDRDKESAKGREGAEISNKIVDNNGNFDESPKTEAGNETEKAGGGGQSPIIDGEGEKQTSGDRDKESAEGREEGAEVSDKTYYHNDKNQGKNANHEIKVIEVNNNLIKPERSLQSDDKNIKAEPIEMLQISRTKIKDNFINRKIFLGDGSFDFVWIPPGSPPPGYLGGKREDQAVEKVIGMESLSRGFWIGKYEISKEQWKSNTGTEPWKDRKRPLSHIQSTPVILTVKEIKEFIMELNKRGLGYFRLPTDAEWEYVDRSGGLSNVSPNGLGFRIIKDE